MLAKIREIPRMITRLTRRVAWISVTLMSIGIMSDLLVVSMNQGKMPIAMHAGDILFVVGEAQLGVFYFPVAYELSEKYQPLTESTKFRILADRIPIFIQIHSLKRSPPWTRQLIRKTKLPINEGSIASIGDLAMWLGLLLTIPTMPILFVHGTANITRQIILCFRKKS